MQAVAAEQEDVAGPDLAVGAVDLDLAADADGARENMAHRVANRLLRLHQPAVDHFLDLAVIAAELDEVAVAQQIGAAVADPLDQVALAADKQGDDGGPHLPAALAALCGDRLVRRPHRLGDALARRVEVVGQVDHAELADHPSRRPLAALVAAHPVGDRPEALALARAEAVLIVDPHAPLVGQRRAFDDEGDEAHRARAAARDI